MPAEVVEIKGLEGALDMLKSLPPALVSKRGGVVLAGLRKGGNLMRKAWRQEIQRILDEPNKAGDYVSTGLYQKSIVVSRVKDPKKIGADEAVRVRVKNATYPATGVNVGLVAGVLEHGSETVPAKAPMRKAFDSTKSAALDAIVKGINDGIEKAIKKLNTTAKP